MHLPVALEDKDGDEPLEALPGSNDSFASVLVRNGISFSSYSYISYM